MLRSLDYKVFNQSVDFHLGMIEDEAQLKQLKESYRKLLFESEAFLLKESSNRTVGAHSEHDDAGTALFAEDEEWVLNFGFGRMDMESIRQTLMLFEPLGKIVDKFQGDTVVSFLYVLEDVAGTENGNKDFLKEISLTPERLVEDELQRLCRMRRMRGGMAYTLHSVKKDSLSLEDSAALLQKEKNNMERIFIPSLYTWLNSLTAPQPPAIEANDVIDCYKIALQSGHVN
jgi:hypothetical protein